MKTRTSPAGNSGLALLEAAPRSYIRGSHCQAGFTLLELIIVLFIVGIAGAVAVIAAGNMHEKTLFNEEARKLFQTLKHAREISLLERKDVIFEFDDEGKSYWLKSEKNAGPSFYRLPDKFMVTGETIVFFPKGNSSGGTVKLTDGKKRQYTITVDPVLGTPAVGRI